jgi:hypothetical protein
MLNYQRVINVVMVNPMINFKVGTVYIPTISGKIGDVY